jgi:thiol-disulfide isomerase/thioredoxin
MLKTLLFFFVTLLPTTLWADIHKCIIDGKTVYTDQDCGDHQSLPFELIDINTTAATSTSYKGSIWLMDNNGYTIASEASVAEKAPVLIYGYTDWCQYCKKLEAMYFNDYKVNNVLAKFIKVKLNPEHSAKDKQLFNSMNGTGYPTLFIKYPNQAPQKIRLPSFKGGDASTPAAKEEFIAMLQTHLKPFEKIAAEKPAP